MHFNIIALIPARGGSKRIQKKNIRLFAGKPLIAHTIELAKKSSLIDRIFVTTEDKGIMKISKEYGAEIIKRPKELATDTTPSLPVFKHAITYLEENNICQPDIIAILQPTSPLRMLDDVEGCIKKLQEGKHDSVITVKKVNYPINWIVQLDADNKIQKINTKNIDYHSNIYIPNGSVYATWRDTIIKLNTFRGPDTRALIIPDERSIDIDTEFEFKLAEYLKQRSNT